MAMTTPTHGSFSARPAIDQYGQDDDDASFLVRIVMRCSSLHTCTLCRKQVPPRLPPSAASSGSSIVKQGWLQRATRTGTLEAALVRAALARYYYMDSENEGLQAQGRLELKQAKLVVGWEMYKKSPTNHVFQLQLPKGQYFSVQLQLWSFSSGGRL